jgi:hypothetical protein
MGLTGIGPLIMFGIEHQPWVIPLCFMAYYCLVAAMFSGVRPVGVIHENQRTAESVYGIECRMCDQASPICRTRQAVYRWEERHAKATGHLRYIFIPARVIQLEVI